MNVRTLPVSLPLLVLVALAALPRSASAGCVIPGGQDGSLTALFSLPADGDDHPAAAADSVAVQRDGLSVTWSDYTFRLRRATAAEQSAEGATGVWYVTPPLFCEPGLCASLDKRLRAALVARGDSVTWRCDAEGEARDAPRPGGAAADPGAAAADPGAAAADPGAALRSVDEALSRADLAVAIDRLEAAAKAVPGSDAGAHFDIASVAGRLAAKATGPGGREVRARATTIERAAAARGFEAWEEHGGVQALNLDTRRDQALLERVAAALVRRGAKATAADERARLDEGEALIRQTCWSRAPAPGCEAGAVAEALQRAGERERAAKLLDDELKRHEKPTPALFLQRIGLASRQNDAAAEVATAEAAVKAWPEDTVLKDALATAYFRAERFADSIHLLEEVYRAKPDTKGVLARISGVFNAMAGATNRKDGPHEAFAKLRDEMAARAKKDDNDIVARFLAAVGHYYDGDLEQAITAMGAVAPRAPSEARVYIYMGMAHFWLGREATEAGDKAEATRRQAEAERLIDKAREANPYDPDVYYCLSQVHRHTDLDAGIRYLERYLQLSAAPGALQYPKKTRRVGEELEMMRSGTLPPDWDKPGRERTVDSLKEPVDLPPMWLLLALGAAVLGGVALALVVLRRSGGGG